MSYKTINDTTFQVEEDGTITDFKKEGSNYFLEFPNCTSIRLDKAKRYPGIMVLRITEPEDARNFEIEIVNESFPDLTYISIQKEGTTERKYQFDKNSRILARYGSDGGMIVNCWKNTIYVAICELKNIIGASEHAFDGADIYQLFFSDTPKKFETKKGYIQLKRSIVLTSNLYTDRFEVPKCISMFYALVSNEHKVHCRELVVDSDTGVGNLSAMVPNVEKLILSGKEGTVSLMNLKPLLVHSGVNKIISENENLVVEDGIVYNREKTKLILCPPWKEKVKVPDGVIVIGFDAFRYDRKRQKKATEQKVCVETEVELPATVQIIQKRGLASIRKVKLNGTVPKLGCAISFPVIIETANGFQTFIPKNMSLVFMRNLQRYAGGEEETRQLDAEILSQCKSSMSKCEYVLFKIARQQVLDWQESNIMKRNAKAFFDYLQGKGENEASILLLKSGFLTKPKLEAIIQQAEEKQDLHLKAYALEALNKKTKASSRSISL